MHKRGSGLIYGKGPPDRPFPLRPQVLPWSQTRGLRWDTRWCDMTDTHGTISFRVSTPYDLVDVVECLKSVVGSFILNRGYVFQSPTPWDSLTGFKCIGSSSSILNLGGCRLGVRTRQEKGNTVGRQRVDYVRRVNGFLTLSKGFRL